MAFAFLERTPDWGSQDVTWWSASRLLANPAGWLSDQPPLWPRHGGSHTKKRIPPLGTSGVTKDATGTPLAGVTVMAIRATADVANNVPANVQEGTISLSDSVGNYEVMVPTGDNYQLIAYKAGSPDVAGLTVNTLVGGA